MVLHRAVLYTILTSLLFIAKGSFAQNNQVKVANEYFNKKDYEKAYDYYKKLIRDNGQRKYVYNNYLTSVRKLGIHEKGLDQIKKLKKNDPVNYTYQVDEILLLRESGNKSKSDQYLSKLTNENKASKINVEKLYHIFSLRQMNDDAVELLLESRNVLKTDYVYSEELSVLYKHLGKKDKMIDELLNLLVYDKRSAEAVENSLQQTLQTEKDYEVLINKVYARLGEKSNVRYNGLLVWIYIQQKDFYNAFIQQKSIDKQLPSSRGRELIELGDISALNRDYKTALKVYTYVTEQYPDDYHFVNTQRKRIEIKEIIAKDKYPVLKESIVEIISDYDVLLEKSRRSEENAKIRISQAELYAVYLHNEAKAIELLNVVTTNLRLPRRVIAQAKILLGDIHVLSDDTGEAMLMYMQVEREMEDDEQGNIAKLKTAKVSYFDGEFELAQAHLDILKRATQRKIANDAQDLSLLIKGNLDLDTTSIPMEMYSKTELLVFQKKYTEALELLESINRLFPNHALTDEIHYQRAQIFKETTEYAKAVVELGKVTEDAESVLSDDAVYEMAELYERRLGDLKNAKEQYKKLLIDHSGSIHVEEARKRYYELESVK